jgi:hypothetical protein
MIQLTPAEQSIIVNSDFFLSKRAVIQKIEVMFEGLQFRLQEIAHNNLKVLPDRVVKSNAKISKGENYKGLPYVVLDYPAYYTKSDIFAFRSLFWWGKYLSFSFHLQGEAFEQFKPLLIKNSEKLAGSDFYLCVNNTPWEYHFEKENFIKIQQLKEQEIIHQINSSNFFKIASKTTLDALHIYPDQCVKQMNQIISFIS